MDRDALVLQKNSLIKTIPELNEFISSFSTINKLWTGAITAGMIETGRMGTEAAKLFGPLVQDMRLTKDKYSVIQEQFVDVILFEMARKVVSEISDVAKFAINILKRNLFERTADVGYLATDVELVNFLKMVLKTEDQDRIIRQRDFIHKRLADYQYEYTVYNDIIILDLDGNVQVNLNQDNKITHSRDPLLRATQEINLHANLDEDKFLETFRCSDLYPNADNVLIYSHKIEDPETHNSLGTLCLCFDFEDELGGIFKDLRQGNEDIVVAILDADGAVLSSNNTRVLPMSAKVQVDLEADFRFISFNGTSYLVSTVATDGYQGFFGLTWYGLAMINAEQAFRKGSDENLLTETIIQRLQNFSEELSVVKYSSDELLDDMKIDSINGKIQALVFNANAFVEVLHFINNIGEEINVLFSGAIENLQKTVIMSLFNDVQFRAFQGNNIADRNLYERANDVCWWALSPLFRNLLTKHQHEEIDKDEQQALTDTLQYINDLYTPYLRIILATPDGVILATSDPPSELEEHIVQEGLPRGQEFVGMQLDAALVKKATRLKSSKDYCVSDFDPTFLYGGRPTYIYSTAVRDPENEKVATGVIQIVFDSEPQFKSMLEDILPKDDQGAVIKGSFGIFADRKKTIISSTSAEYPVGSKLQIEDSFFNEKSGARVSAVVDLASNSYAMGLQVSDGYREYKTSDGYKNDLICLVFIPI